LGGSAGELTRIPQQLGSMFTQGNGGFNPTHLLGTAVQEVGKTLSGLLSPIQNIVGEMQRVVSGIPGLDQLDVPGELQGAAQMIQNFDPSALLGQAGGVLTEQLQNLGVELTDAGDGLAELNQLVQSLTGSSADGMPSAAAHSIAPGAQDAPADPASKEPGAVDPEVAEVTPQPTELATGEQSGPGAVHTAATASAGVARTAAPDSDVAAGEQAGADLDQTVGEMAETGDTQTPADTATAGAATDAAAPATQPAQPTAPATQGDTAASDRRSDWLGTAGPAGTMTKTALGGAALSTMAAAGGAAATRRDMPAKPGAKGTLAALDKAGPAAADAGRMAPAARSKSQGKPAAKTLQLPPVTAGAVDRPALAKTVEQPGFQLSGKGQTEAVPDVAKEGLDLSGAPSIDEVRNDPAIADKKAKVQEMAAAVGSAGAAAKEAKGPADGPTPTAKKPAHAKTDHSPAPATKAGGPASKGAIAPDLAGTGITKDGSGGKKPARAAAAKTDKGGANKGAAPAKSLTKGGPAAAASKGAPAADKRPANADVSGANAVAEKSTAPQTKPDSDQAITDTPHADPDSFTPAERDPNARAAAQTAGKMGPAPVIPELPKAAPSQATSVPATKIGDAAMKALPKTVDLSGDVSAGRAALTAEKKTEERVPPTADQQNASEVEPLTETASTTYDGRAALKEPALQSSLAQAMQFTDMAGADQAGQLSGLATQRAGDLAAAAAPLDMSPSPAVTEGQQKLATLGQDATIKAEPVAEDGEGEPPASELDTTSTDKGKSDIDASLAQAGDMVDQLAPGDLDIAAPAGASSGGSPGGGARAAGGA
ncbi:MAG: hypothetical protein AAGC55_13805, partial [Myxococcota bacterium]